MMEIHYCIVGCTKMNERFFTNTITIYNKKQDESFQGTIINKVYARKNRKIVVNSNGEEVASSETIIIPTKIATINNQLAINSYIDNRSLDKNSSILNFTLNSALIDTPWTIMAGDYIVDGYCDLDFDITKIKKEHKLFQIISYADNRKGNLQHFKIEVSE